MFEGGREFFVDNLLVRIHFMIDMICWTGFAPWEFEFPLPGSLISSFLVCSKLDGVLGAGRRSSCPTMPTPGGRVAATIDPASQNASSPDIAGVRAHVTEDGVDKVHEDEIQMAAEEMVENSGAGALPDPALGTAEPHTTESHERISYS